MDAAWHRLLQEIELAKNYHLCNLEMGCGVRNPILDYLLPSLLYVKLVSLFDEGLTIYIANHNLTIPKKYKKDLYGKIEFLNVQKVIYDSGECHRVRQKRNDVAHDSSKTASWSDLNEDLEVVEGELKNLKLVGECPNYKFYAERSGAKKSNEPGVLFTQDYCYGIKSNGNKKLEVSWTKRILSE